MRYGTLEAYVEQVFQPAVASFVSRLDPLHAEATPSTEQAGLDARDMLRTPPLKAAMTSPPAFAGAALTTPPSSPSRGSRPMAGSSSGSVIRAARNVFISPMGGAQVCSVCLYCAATVANTVYTITDRRPSLPPKAPLVPPLRRCPLARSKQPPRVQKSLVLRCCRPSQTFSRWMPSVPTHTKYPPTCEYRARLQHDFQTRVYLSSAYCYCEGLPKTTNDQLQSPLTAYL